MKVLVIGGGGREHTLVWKLAQSKRVSKIFAIPGNGGISEIAECHSIDLGDFSKIYDFVMKKKIDLIVVGPEDPLVRGISDFFREKGIEIFGPSKRSAMLEGSKVFAKEFMKRYGIPTADFEVFNNPEKAQKYARDRFKKGDLGSLVVKADGLAQGKGVIVCDSLDEVEGAIKEIMIERRFGNAGERIILEERLVGEEASLIAFCDSEAVVPMLASQDHKQVFDDDKGPNTGGMGAYASCPVVDESLYNEARKEIFDRFLIGLNKENLDYNGVIYAGIMITASGPRVLEFNIRFGDPETQAILPLLNTDLIDIIEKISQKKLSKIEISWKNGYAICVVMASGGYPQKYEKGKLITGLERVKEIENVSVFHAGTKRDEDRFYTSGGRVLGVTAWSDTLDKAFSSVYNAIDMIRFDGVHYRKDIGKKGLRAIGSAEFRENTEAKVEG